MSLYSRVLLLLLLICPIILNYNLSYYSSITCDINKTRGSLKDQLVVVDDRDRLPFL